MAEKITTRQQEAIKTLKQSIYQSVIEFEHEFQDLEILNIDIDRIRAFNKRSDICSLSLDVRVYV